MDSVAVEHARPDQSAQSAQLEQMVPVASVACEPRCLQAEDSADDTFAELRDERFEARACARAACRLSQVVVDDDDVAKPEIACPLCELVLASLTLEIFLDLAQGRFTNVDDRTPLENTTGKLTAFHRAPPLAPRPRRPRAGSRTGRAGSPAARSARLRKGRGRDGEETAVAGTVLPKRAQAARGLEPLAQATGSARSDGRNQ